MRITAGDLKELRVVDRIVPEPPGGAHRDPPAACAALKTALAEELDALAGQGPDELRRGRRARFLDLG